MMKKLMMISVLAALIACDNGDPGPSAADVYKELTSGPGLTARWVVKSAQLTPSIGASPIDITNLANVKDDEFLFTAVDGGSQELAVSMEWRSRNAIRRGANSRENALLDYYRSSSLAGLTIKDGGAISSDMPELNVSMQSSNEAIVRYESNGSTLVFNIVQEESGEGLATASLDFSAVTTITGKGLEQAAGFTGSMSSNALYLCYRRLDGGNAEKVVRLDLNTLATTSHEFVKPDFVTKELHIINDELKVVGAQYVNTYPLDLSSDPVSVPHQLKLTRYGSTVVDDKVILFGGDLDGLNDNDSTTTTANRIYEHDQVTGLLSQIGTLPESRFWAHGEMVDGKLYVFGGRTGFIAPEGQDEILIWDSAKGTTEALKLPAKMSRTFAARVGHLILVAGQRENKGATDEDWSITTTFGYYNTQDNTYHELPSSLAGTSQQSVYGLTLIADTLYVLYGSATSSEFTIYKAAIN